MNIEYGKCYQYGTLRGDSDTFHQRLAWEVFDTVLCAMVKNLGTLPRSGDGHQSSKKGWYADYNIKIPDIGWMPTLTPHTIVWQWHIWTHMGGRYYFTCIQTVYGIYMSYMNIDTSLRTGWKSVASSNEVGMHLWLNWNLPSWWRTLYLEWGTGSVHGHSFLLGN